MFFFQNPSYYITIVLKRLHIKKHIIPLTVKKDALSSDKNNTKCDLQYFVPSIHSYVFD